MTDEFLTVGVRERVAWIEYRRPPLNAIEALERGGRLLIGGRAIESLTHACDFAGFRRELEIPVYRDADGFCAAARDDRFSEEVSLPLGKAFLLCSTPWEGTKAIPSRC